MGTYTKGVAVADAALLSQPRNGEQGGRVICIRESSNWPGKGGAARTKTDKDWKQYELLCRGYNPVGWALDSSQCYS